MPQFLEEWDDAIDSAIFRGEPSYLYGDPNPDGTWQLLGRTMHPVFMAPSVNKFDPERDNAVKGE